MRALAGTVAVVTGAASGIGRALALRLAQEGCMLALGDLDDAGLADSAAAARAIGVRVSTHQVDVSDPMAMEEFRDAVLREHGRVTLLVNNAGVAMIGTVTELGLDDIAWLMGINFWGVVHGVKVFLPVLQQQYDAHIVNLSSIFGIVAPPGQAAYAASKFAVRGFSEALRHELAAAGSTVKVSVVHPGGIATPIAANARAAAGVSNSRRSELTRVSHRSRAQRRRRRQRVSCAVFSRTRSASSSAATHATSIACSVSSRRAIGGSQRAVGARARRSGGDAATSRHEHDLADVVAAFDVLVRRRRFVETE
jgi:NAD(P)-dependent dehydrogenase (short-subunit alcohol dehydrogenase family)